MANVKKCDICGAVYEGVKCNSRFLFSSGLISSSITIDEYSNTDTNKYKRFETCPCCTKTVKEFIEFMKKQKKTEASSAICRRGLFRRRNVPQGFFVYEYPF